MRNFKRGFRKILRELPAKFIKAFGKSSWKLSDKAYGSFQKNLAPAFGSYLAKLKQLLNFFLFFLVGAS